MSDDIKRPRFSIDLPKNYQVFLAQQAKTHKITQGELVELLLKNMYRCSGIEDEFKSLRDEKVKNRTTRRLERAFERMTPEQRSAALATLNARVQG